MASIELRTPKNKPAYLSYPIFYLQFSVYGISAFFSCSPAVKFVFILIKFDLF